jgi:hypothetical protein
MGVGGFVGGPTGVDYDNFVADRDAGYDGTFNEHYKSEGSGRLDQSLFADFLYYVNNFDVSLEWKFGKNWFVYNNKEFGQKVSLMSLNLTNLGACWNSISELYYTWDPISNKRISQLHPVVQGLAINFINRVEIELGIKLRVTDGLRSFEKQNTLYAKGRTLPGQIVTNAKGGESYHNYGLAIDVVEIRNGKVNWNTNWTSISLIGLQNGFKWGGNFKNLSDKPHFEMTFGYSISDLLKLYNSGKWE